MWQSDRLIVACGDICNPIEMTTDYRCTAVTKGVFMILSDGDRSYMRAATPTDRRFLSSLRSQLVGPPRNLSLALSDEPVTTPTGFSVGTLQETERHVR